MKGSYHSDSQRSFGPLPREEREGRGPAVHGLPRNLAALHDSRRQAGRGRVRGRPGFRRFQHPRLAGDQRERHARGPAAGDGRPGPVHHAAHPVDDLQHPGPHHPRGLFPRSPQRRPQGGQLPEEHRHRRHGLHGPGVGVLHFRRRPLRSEHPEQLLLHRQHRRPVEPRPRGEAQPGQQAPLQGRLLPRAAGRPVDGHPQRDDADAGRLRHQHRGPAPRGGHRRAGRRST